MDSSPRTLRIVQRSYREMVLRAFVLGSGNVWLGGTIVPLAARPVAFCSSKRMD